MQEELVIVPSNGDGYVALARTKTGRLFRKHLLNFGDLRHPVTGETVKIDEDFATSLKTNFANNVCDIVQVPLANDRNEHSEAPERNIGEVVDIEIKDQKVYAVMDIRDPAHADRMGKTYLGASAMLHLDYTDTKTGTKVGPTLLHSCVTNRPYVTGLANYEEIVEKTIAATNADKNQRAVLLTTEDVVVIDPPEVDTPPAVEGTTDMGDTTDVQETAPKPTLEDLLASLKTDHNIDVPALQAKAAEGDQAASLSNTLVKALTDAGVVKLTNTDESTVDNTVVAGAVTELAASNIALTNRINVLERKDAEHLVDSLVRTGHIIPGQRNDYVDLKLTNPTMFERLVPKDPIVKLDNETGVAPKDDAAHKKNVDDEIARLTAAYLS